MLSVQGRAGGTCSEKEGKTPAKKPSARISPNLGTICSTIWPRKQTQRSRLICKKSAVCELKKSKAAEGIRELLLKDQRAKLAAQATKLSTTVDKQQEFLATVYAKLQDLRKELATCYPDIMKLVNGYRGGASDAQESRSSDLRPGNS
eukprot:6399417-Amphidinium_carterae.1